jgi:hypothetical protein
MHTLIFDLSFLLDVFNYWIGSHQLLIEPLILVLTDDDTQVFLDDLSRLEEKLRAWSWGALSHDSLKIISWSLIVCEFNLSNVLIESILDVLTEIILILVY